MAMQRAALFAASAAIVSIMFASLASAGVVISQTEEKNGPGGQTAEARTIYVQGNKEKIDTARNQTIADLDRHVMYIVDVSHRVYAEVPLRAVQSPSQPGASAEDDAVRLKRTGVTRSVGAYPCQEYRGGGGNAIEHLSVSACVSNEVPGANEVARFDRNMMRQLTGTAPQGSRTGDSTAMVLEENSRLELRMPSMPGSDAPARKVSVVSKKRVNDVKLQQLPSEIFRPPQGFNKVERNSQGNMI
jgi:hypothetical protein